MKPVIKKGGRKTQHMRSVKETQAYLFELLVALDAFCEKNGIHYSLCGGTALGAVRHRGFIPWDDDADVMMTRAEYEKFIRTFRKSRPEEYILTGKIWVPRFTRKDNPYREQESGCVDIFIMDRLPDSAFAAKLKILLLKLLQGMMKKEIDYEKYSLAQKLLVGVTHLMGLPFSDKRKRRWYRKASMMGR